MFATQTTQPSAITKCLNLYVIMFCIVFVDTLFAIPASSYFWGFLLQIFVLDHARLRDTMGVRRAAIAAQEAHHATYWPHRGPDASGAKNMAREAEEYLHLRFTLMVYLSIANGLIWSILPSYPSLTRAVMTPLIVVRLAVSPAIAAWIPTSIVVESNINFKDTNTFLRLLVAYWTALAHEASLATFFFTRWVSLRAFAIIRHINRKAIWPLFRFILLLPVAVVVLTPRAILYAGKRAYCFAVERIKGRCAWCGHHVSKSCIAAYGYEPACVRPSAYRFTSELELCQASPAPLLMPNKNMFYATEGNIALFNPCFPGTVSFPMADQLLNRPQ